MLSLVLLGTRSLGGASLQSGIPTLSEESAHVPATAQVAQPRATAARPVFAHVHAKTGAAARMSAGPRACHSLAMQSGQRLRVYRSYGTVDGLTPTRAVLGHNPERARIHRSAHE